MPGLNKVLAYTNHPDVEKVLAAIETGEQLTVAQVKAIIGATPAKKATSSNDVLNAGGTAGLRKVAEMKYAQDVARFDALMSRILKEVETALEPLARGRAVIKVIFREP